MLFAGCSSTEVSYQESQNLPLLSRPSGVELARINAVTIKNDGKMYIAIDTDNYKILSNNINKIIRYSKDQSVIIDNYEKLIEKHNLSNQEKAQR